MSIISGGNCAQTSLHNYKTVILKFANSKINMTTQISNRGNNKGFGKRKFTVSANYIVYVMVTHVVWYSSVVVIRRDF